MADQRLVEMIMSGRSAGANLAGESFMGTNLRGADFRRTNLEGAVFQIANLVAADFRGVNLAYADFIDADLSSAKLQGAILDGAHLQGAILNGADLTGADLRYANLQYANFSRANLNGADLTGAKKIENAILKGVKYDSNTVWPDGFTPPSGGRMASRASQGVRKAAISRDLVPSITLNGSDPSRLIEEVRNTRELLREAERSMYRPHGRDWFDNFREAALVTGKFMAAMYDYVELCNHVEMAARDYLDSKSKFSRSASGSNRLSRFEEGVPADPTENMSPEDAAEWEEMNEKYGDKFKKASRGSRYAAGKIVAREPYMRALQRMQDAFDRSGGDPVKLYDAIDRRVRATRELGKLQGIYDAIIFDVMRGTFGPVPRFLDVRYKALLDQLQQVLRVSRSF